ncbi:MAG: DMT family transporter [Patescibacteria group bacterium]
MPWYVIALGSAIFIGLYEVAEKKALVKERSLIFLLTSSLLMLVLSVPLIFWGHFEIVGLQMTLYILAKCIFAVTLFILCAKAMKHMEISEFAPLMNLSPLVLFIPSIFLLQEKLTLVNIAGVLMIVFGAYIVELKDGWRTPLKRALKNKYIHLLFLAFVFNALSATMDKFILSKTINVDTFFVYNRFFIAILLLFAYFIFKDKNDSMMVTFKRSFWWVLLAAVLFMGADYVYFSAVAIPATAIALIIPLKRTGTLIATVLGGEMMKEDNLLRKAIACVIMIVGVTLIII